MKNMLSVPLAIVATLLFLVTAAWLGQDISGLIWEDPTRPERQPFISAIATAAMGMIALSAARRGSHHHNSGSCLLCQRPRGEARAHAPDGTSD